jgi:hypothetical protein
MALEDMNTLRVPFIGEVEIETAAGFVMLIVSIIGGSMVYQIGQSAGTNLADWASQKFAAITGVNPQTGDSGPAGEGGV